MIGRMRCPRVHVQLNPRVQKYAGTILSLLDKPLRCGTLNLVSTSSERVVQLYGWRSPISEHVDNTGYVFFCPILINGVDAVYCNGTKARLEVGQIYLLDDRQAHSTVGEGDVVALFLGSFQANELTQELMQSVCQQFNEYLQF